MAVLSAPTGRWLSRNAPYAYLKVHGVHFQLRGVDKVSGTDELVVQIVIAQNVAHVLAEETLDALTEFLGSVDIRLLHAPGTIGGIRLAWLEFRNLHLDPVVPGDV